MLSEPLLAIIVSSLVKCVLLQETYYTAAVVEYMPYWQAATPDELLEKNIKEYTLQIDHASKKGAQIIVFPEYGLTHIYAIAYAEYRANNSKLEDYGLLVPDFIIADAISPCLNQANFTFSQHLIALSCAAHHHDLYVVVNVLEKQFNLSTCTYDLFNTNVVFDRKGAVIAKYRKIRLSEEQFLKPGEGLVTFQTDFGVTFGMIICYDILFKYPALDLFADPYVTDVIFPEAWFTETPFLGALTIAHGYAKTNGINLLAAGLKVPKNQDGGSGIFLADGTIGQSHISANTDRSTLLIHDVPIITQRTPFNSCQQSYVKDDWIPVTMRDEQKLEENFEVENFFSSPQNLSNYTFESLNKGPLTLEIVCSKDNTYCCSFTIDMDENSYFESNATYKLIAFQGLENFGSDNLAVRACALVYCLNESRSSCGERPTKDIILPTFRKITIAGFFNKTNDIYDQPATLKQDLTTIENYLYCENAIEEGKIEVILETVAPQHAVLTFGIFGRIYNLEQNKKEDSVSYSWFVLIISAGFLLLICLLSFVINHCKVKPNTSE